MAPPRNQRRRDALADAAITVLGTSGIHALSHRSVDDQAGLPAGTAANYFPTRDELLTAAARRVFGLHIAAMEAADRQVTGPTAPDGLAELIGGALYDGAVHHRNRYLAVYELTLEATRRPALAEALSDMLSTSLDVTIGQHRMLGLDTTPMQVQTLITLFSGVLLTLTTAPPETVTPDTARILARCLVTGVLATVSGLPEGAILHAKRAERSRRQAAPSRPCYRRHVEIRSLGWRTDLAILALGGSTVSDRDDHLVVRTPGNPDYWWGNFLLLRDLGPGSGTHWQARFAAEFPDARHVALGLDETDSANVAAGELPGMTMDTNAVMTATSLCAPPHPNAEAVFRPLKGDADWQQSLELATALGAGGPGYEGPFLTTMTASRRSLAEAGHGHWFGAFRNGRLVAQLGLVSVSPGIARYQSVETHPGARRRGLAGTLVWQAGSAALNDQARTLVMVADPDDAAIRVYRSVGFDVTEFQHSFIRQPPATA